MPLTRDQKQEIINKYGKSPTDSGTPEVQIALLTERINELSGHFTAHSADNHSRLTYLQSKGVERYRKIIEELDLRK